MHRGFTTLMMTVIALSVALATALATAQIGLVGALDDKLRTNRLQARHSADACAEVALLAIRDSGSLSGSISDSPITCTYTTTSLGGDAYSVSAEGMFGGATHSVSVNAAFDGQKVSVSSWTHE